MLTEVSEKFDLVTLLYLNSPVSSARRAHNNSFSVIAAYILIYAHKYHMFRRSIINTTPIQLDKPLTIIEICIIYNKVCILG